MKALIYLSLFISLNSFAEFDLSVATQGRSYPGVGGEASVKLGYNVPIWGKIEKGKVSYGMFRLQSRLASSVVVSNVDHSISFYPISFIAFGAGRKEMNSNFEEFVFYNCEEVRCKGKLNKDYLFAKMALGWGGLLTSYSYTESRNSYDDPSGTALPVGEYEFLSVVSPLNETSINQFSFLGYKTSHGLIGALSRRVYYQESKQEFFNHFLFYNWKLDRLGVALGGGNIYSTHIKPSPVVFFRLTYALYENKSLF